MGIEFYQNPATPAPKDAPPKTDEPAADPKEPAGPLQGDQRSGGSTQTTTAGSQPSYRKQESGKPEHSWSCLDWSCRNGPEKEGTT